MIRNLVKRLQGLALFLLWNGHAGRTKGTDDMLRLTMKKWAILFCLISPTAFSFSEEIYRWTDDKGSVHFTDDVSNIPAPYLILQRQFYFKCFRLSNSLLPVRDICDIVTTSVIFDDFYGSFQSQRIERKSCCNKPLCLR